MCIERGSKWTQNIKRVKPVTILEKNANQFSSLRIEENTSNLRLEQSDV